MDIPVFDTDGNRYVIVEIVTPKTDKINIAASNECMDLVDGLPDPGMILIRRYKEE